MGYYDIGIVGLANLDEMLRENKYFFLYYIGEPEKVFDVFKRFADNPELSFSDGDLEYLTEKVKEQVEEALA